MTYDNRELFARLIACEAGGEGDSGMRAVATVVMNRVDVPNGEYQRVNQGDIRSVIMQQYQFDCARSTIRGGSNPQSIYTVNPELIHYEIADWALGGGRLNQVGNCLWFFNPYGDCVPYFPVNRSGSFLTRITDHCFYQPTPRYATT